MKNTEKTITIPTQRYLDLLRLEELHRVLDNAGMDPMDFNAEAMAEERLVSLDAKGKPVYTVNTENVSPYAEQGRNGGGQMTVNRTIQLNLLCDPKLGSRFPEITKAFRESGAYTSGLLAFGGPLDFETWRRA